MKDSPGNESNQHSQPLLKGKPNGLGILDRAIDVTIRQQALILSLISAFLGTASLHLARDLPPLYIFVPISVALFLFYKRIPKTVHLKQPHFIRYVVT